MAMRSAFNMHHSDLQNFLFAPVWDEKNGTTLSILSALARLDMDPWREAARLADMPRSVAATTLASILARLPGDNLKLSDSATLSQRLVEFLPEGRSNAGTETTGVGNSDDNGGSWRNIAIGVALAAILVISQMNGWLFQGWSPDHRDFMNSPVAASRETGEQVITEPVKPALFADILHHTIWCGDPKHTGLQA